jgi:hypothetical protein
MMRRFFILLFALVLSGCQTRTAAFGRITISEPQDLLVVSCALKEEFVRLGFRPYGEPAPNKNTVAFFSGGNSGDQVCLRMIARGTTVSLYFNPRSPDAGDETAAADVAKKIQRFLAERFPAYPCDFSSGPKLYSNPDYVL